MSIWGKIVGAAAGFVFFGGPIGAILGALAGHYAWDRSGGPKRLANKGRSRDDDDDDEDDDDDRKSRRRADRQRQKDQARADAFAREQANAHAWRQKDPNAANEVAFTVGVIALFAKMAKADGLVTRDEIDAFNQVFDVPASERAHVGRIFDQAKQSIAGFEDYAQQIAGLFRERPAVLADLLDALFLIAAADRRLHAGEDEFLRRCARIFGIPDFQFDRLRETHFGPDHGDPYRILGVQPTASNDELKRAYHQAVKDNHPDSLIARGVPAEFIKLASDKLAAINGAYERVKRARGLT